MTLIPFLMAVRDARRAFLPVALMCHIRRNACRASVFIDACAFGRHSIQIAAPGPTAWPGAGPTEEAVWARTRS